MREGEATSLNIDSRLCPEQHKTATTPFLTKPERRIDHQRKRTDEGTESQGESNENCFAKFYKQIRVYTTLHRH